MVSGVAGVWAGPTTPFAGVTRNVRLSVKRGWGPFQGSLWTPARCGGGGEDRGHAPVTWTSRSTPSLLC